MSEFEHKLRSRLEEEERDGVRMYAVAERLGVTGETIGGWLRGKWPRPKYHAAIARLLRVPAAQMVEWFPDDDRRRRQAVGKSTPVEAA